MRRIFASLLAVAAVLCATCAFAEMTLSRSSFAKGVTAREPEGVAEAFPATVGKVYLFNQVSGVTGPTMIKHVWIYDNKVQLEVKLAVEGEGWRVWSAKAIPKDQAGKWNVEVLDSAGNVLESASFTVTK